MTRAPRPLPPPAMRERADAATAARALRAAIADPTTMGERSVMFVDFGRPSRGECRVTWTGLPGFCRVGDRCRYELLAGWEDTWAEVRAEMIPDLEALAERGVRPTEATSAGVSR